MKKRVPVSSVMEALLGTVDNSADIEHEIDKMEEMLEQYKREHIK